MEDFAIELKDPEKMMTWEITLTRCFSLRVQAADLRKQAADLEAEANTLMAAFAKATDIKEVESSAGILTFIPAGKSASFKKDVLKKFLVNKGVSADLVKEGFEAATSYSDRKEQVRWSKPKKKEE